MKQVIHHQRKPALDQISIERLFEGIREEFTSQWQVLVSVCPHPSRGLIPRLRNLKVVSNLKADIHHIVGDVHYLALGIPGEKLVLTIHDCAVLERLNGWRREVIRQLWFVQPMRRAVAVTTISQTSKDELRKWVGALADKVEVIPNCVRSEFRPDFKPFNNKFPVVLQVGTGWNKNVVGVARGLTGIRCRLEIVGELDSSQRTALDSTYVDYKVLGRVSDEDLLEAYRRCDLLVFVSLYEGFGLPILEAQAIGRPVVTSNLSSMPEVSGGGALLVDPSDSQAIHGAVMRLILDTTLRADLVQAGFDNVARFRSEAVARRYEAVYARVLNNQNKKVP